ncbi:MAG: DNA polymerase Y family protein [Burkholderiaceae bacterium]|nr:DNA polymerase Y family protein [Burkholderiaceae bacterium]
MHWLALHLPQLSLEAFAATLSEAERHTPLALVVQHRIVAVNGAAAEAGVRTGLKRATALALAPALRLAQAEPARDAAALQAVAHVALVFTPMVVLDDGPATVLLELGSVLRYHGGAARLRTRLHDALAPLGHRLQTATAPTAAGAALLARWGTAAHGDLAHGAHATDLDALRRLLDTAPVWLLGPGREHWEALQGMGLHTLADLRALPRAGLARRFGESLLHELDRARGDAPDPRQPLQPPAVFDSHLELYARADTTDQVLHGAGVLLARLIAWAQARRARIAAFTLRMRHERSRRHDADEGVPAHTTLTVELAEPGADAAQLQLLLRERLARCPLPAPTLELALHCRRWVQAEAPSGELFPSRQGQREGLVRLLERLRARLGDEGVLRLQPLADHRPEHAQRLQAAPVQGVGSTPAPAGGALPLHRPAWLLPASQPLHERSALPLLDGRPLQILSGPERIEAGWWDADLAARDYFIARDDGGALVWIYRTRLAEPGGWFLQGRFG